VLWGGFGSHKGLGDPRAGLDAAADLGPTKGLDPCVGLGTPRHSLDPETDVGTTGDPQAGLDPKTDVGTTGGLGPWSRCGPQKGVGCLDRFASHKGLGTHRHSLDPKTAVGTTGGLGPTRV